MRRPGRQVAATAAVVLAAALCAAAGEVPEAPAAARAFLKELVDPTPLPPAARRRAGKLLADVDNESWRVREAASKELVRMGPRAAPLVARAAKDATGELAVRAEQILAAYRAAQAHRPSLLNQAVDLLAGRKDKTVVDSLLVLLGHADGDIRHVTEYALRRITGKRFGYNAHAPEPERRAAARRWAAWWKAGRRTFAFDRAPAGRIAGVLCRDISGRQLRLIDLEGKTLWSRRMASGLRYAAALPNGNLLFSRSGKGTYSLEEHDAAGKVVWRTDGSVLGGLPRDVSRLPSGTTLALDLTGRRAVEIDRAGRKIVWQYALAATNFHSVQRLANGNTLLCSTSGLAQEVSKAGKVVWSRTDLGATRDVHMLANGNLLVAQYVAGRVVELTRSGQEAWSWSPGVKVRCVAASRLPDGRTVVQAWGPGLFLVDAAGKHAKCLLADEPRMMCVRQFELAPAGTEHWGKGE